MKDTKENVLIHSLKARAQDEGLECRVQRRHTERLKRWTQHSDVI